MIPILLDRLSRKFSGVYAVEELSLEIPSGAIVSLLGPNGAGKSTAIGMMLGYVAPSSGTVTLLGGDPRAIATRRHVGAMLQQPGFPELLKVTELIRLWRSFYPSPLSCDMVLAIAGIEDIAGRHYRNLSGGQKRRVAFALAIAGNPKILFLDEPTVGMDAEARAGLWRTVRDFAGLGKTVLLTTHYTEEADQLSDRVVLMDKGRLLAQGSPSELKGKVSIKSLRCRTSLKPEVLRSIPFVDTLTMSGEDTIIRTRQSDALVRDLLRLDPGLCGLEINAVSLEEAITLLTTKQNGSL